MANHNTDSHFRCIFGSHVLKAAYLIGVFGVIFEATSLVYVYICFKFAGDFCLHGLLDVASLLCYLSLMAAVKREQPKWMWIYLILNSLCTTAEGYLVIVSLHFGRRSNSTSILPLPHDLLVLSASLVNIYCVIVVWRARCYLLQSTNRTVHQLAGPRPYEPTKWRRIQFSIQK
ncbi:hypothetical protein M3Y98_01168500 [Aphelenchoides besseyi]|nr:hypothetical protein M3Y98_01168500 [Aphelenchoides besseyi]KAI6210946.1 hypothetical protein M3Y96_00381500 [Aphelenchoides besseyi]